MIMKILKKEAVALSLLLLAVHIPLILAFPSTVPAFLWSPHSHQMNIGVNYQTISSKDLAKSILSEGGWSNLLCSGNKHQQPLDLALIFVGSMLLSSDIYTNKNSNPSLVNLLKVSVTASNFSLAFPYVTASEEEAIENSLVAEFVETCGKEFWMSNVAFSETCFVEDENFQKLVDMHAVHDYLLSSMERKPNGKSNLIVFCQGSRSMNHGDLAQSESETFSELISSMDTMGAKYAVLYVSDPVRSVQYPSHQKHERFLAENSAFNTTICDEVCQIKTSLLEGVLVGIVLLIILISGLCCMMGIDTPTRFETPQDS